MTGKLRWILIGLAAVGGLGALAIVMLDPFGLPGGLPGGGPGLDAGDRTKVALGRRIYADNCATCHGANLEGQANWRQRRPDGRLPAPPHDAGGHTWHHPGEQLFALTKFGPAALAGGGYQSDMPGYEGQLSDAEIWAVLSFIKSRWPAEIRARHDQMSQ